MFIGTFSHPQYSLMLLIVRELWLLSILVVESTTTEIGTLTGIYTSYCESKLNSYVDFLQYIYK